MFLQFLTELEFQLELQTVEHVMLREETLHLELQDSHSIWLHTEEVQHREMDSLVHADLEQITLQGLAQEEAVKALGKIHGEQAEAEAEQAEQEISLMCTSHLLEDTLDTTVDLDTLQKDHQAEAQVGLTLMIQEEDHKELQVDQAFMV